MTCEVDMADIKELLRELSQKPSPKRRAEIDREIAKSIARARSGTKKLTHTVVIGVTKFDVLDVPTFVREGRPCLDEATSRDVSLRVAAKLVDLGIATGEAFAYLRRALNLKATELAELLDVRPETISQWENGHVPVNRAAWGVLAALVDHEAGSTRSPIDHLRAAKNAKTPKRVRVTLAVA
jgi:DNA-binding transcriptional regulator YiaG